MGEPLIHSEPAFRLMVESVRNALIVVDREGVITFVNPRMESLFSYNKSDLYGKNVAELIAPDMLADFLEFKSRLTIPLQSPVREFIAVRSDGSRFHAELSMSSLATAAEGLLFITVVDLTDQKRIQDDLQKTHRLYAFMSAMKEAIVHAKDEEALLSEVCHIAMDTGGFEAAEIGMLDNEGMLIVRQPPAGSGQMLMLQYHSGMDFRLFPLSGTPTGKVLGTGRYCVVNDAMDDIDLSLWRPSMEQHRIQSCASFPIIRFGKVVGVYSFLSSRKGFFDASEVRFLDEASQDISFALEKIDKDKIRKNTREKLQALNAELAQRNREIESTKENFRALIDKISDAILLVNENGEITFQSPSAERIGGYPESESMGKTVTSFLHPDDVLEFMQLFVELSQHPDSPAERQYRVRHKEGHYIWVEGSITNLLHDENVKAYIINYRDITERKRSEEAVAKSEANLTAIIENTDAYIYSIDREYGYIAFNSRLKKRVSDLYGLDIKYGDKVFGFLEKMEPTEAKEWENVYIEAFTGKTLKFIKEYHFGNIRNFTSFSVNPIWENGEVTGLSCMAIDITQLKQAEAENKSLNELLEVKVKERTANLEEAWRELESFSYTVSHDLQSPLRALSGFSQILLSDYADQIDDEGLGFLNIINGSVRKMSDLIRDLLNFSKLGNAEPDMHQIDMYEIAGFVIVEARMANKPFQTDIRLQSLPVAYGDPSLIRQVWVNLITNAIKYSSGKDTPEIEIGSEEINGETVYYVKDNGAGFDMKHAGKLFSVFQRLHATEEFEGSGVGLAIAHRIVSRHGGRIWAEGKKDEGAVFYFSLPKGHD